MAIARRFNAGKFVPKSRRDGDFQNEMAGGNAAFSVPAGRQRRTVAIKLPLQPLLRYARPRQNSKKTPCRCCIELGMKRW